MLRIPQKMSAPGFMLCLLPAFNASLSVKLCSPNFAEFPLALESMVLNCALQ